MISNEEFKKLIRSTKSRFYLCDFHVHSPASVDLRSGERFKELSEKEKGFTKIPTALISKPSEYEKAAITHFPIEEYYNLLLEQRNKICEAEGIFDGEDWSFIAITDHNVCEYATLLSKFAWEIRAKNKLIILPGIELDVKFKLSVENVTVHILCIFPPNTGDSDIRMALSDASGGNWCFGAEVEVDSLQEFTNKIRNHEDYPAICIAAHVGSGKGIQKESKKALTNLQAAIARAEGEIKNGEDTVELEQLQLLLENLKKNVDQNDISATLLELIGSCGFDALQVKERKDEIHYRRLHRFKPEYGRSVPIICSDSHKVGSVYNCVEMIPYIKYPNISAKISERKIFNDIKDYSLRYGETRFSYKTPSKVEKWISGIEISPESDEAAKFWPLNEKHFVLPLSPNLNCLIGGRGSGKSALIDAISFLAEPKRFKEFQKDRDDSYNRALATIKGCNLRLCWQITSNMEFPKGSMFISRYFDPQGNHLISYSDINGQEITASAASGFGIQLFRIHEVERITTPEKLRSLFDQICGEENVNSVKDEIIGTQKKLKENRDALTKLAIDLNEYTKEAAPLREYSKRLKQFKIVNRKEVQQQYENIDQASVAEKTVDSIVSIAKRIQANFEFEKRRKEIEEFFKYSIKSVDEKDFLKSFESISRLYSELSANSGDNFKTNIFAALTSIEKFLSEFVSTLSIYEEEIKSVHQKARELLVAQGLPPGGKDREAKKSAFDEAVDALRQYREVLAQWSESMEARKELFNSLKNSCEKLTAIRKQTAQNITSQLKRDLDSSVLIIEADAQPSSEKKDFTNWLLENISGSIPRYKSQRVNALIENGITPELLKSVLLGEESAELLVVNRDLAEQGRIDSGEAHKIVSNCLGKRTLLAEIGDQETDIDAELPKEIKEGLVSFPLVNEKNPQSLILNSVLALDEIIFDDIPVIRLNDRPNEKGSLRPLEELSPGQRCSAILPILLINGDTPLIIDQPEDNLDNRLIRQVIVNILASIKLRRQVIFATHNPNLPVLGDAEQSIILRAIEEQQCSLEGLGALEEKNIVKCITDIMEGGREAFQYRQSIYQSHWRGGVD